MEYLLNGNDKERLEYFLRYHPYHNIIMRYRTDYMRLFADFIIDTYLIPEENITNVEELDSFQHLLCKSASEKYFTPDRIIQGLTNGGSVGKILNSQPLIAKALAWLSEKQLIGKQDGLRINIVTSNGFISGYDDNGFGFAENIFTNERLSVEEKNSLILLNLFLLFKNREIVIKGLNSEPIKYSIYREMAALYLLFNILLPILAKEQYSSYSLESFISGVEKIGGSNEQIEEFKRLNRICATACPAVVLEEIFSYLSRYQQNFNQSLYVVHLVNINMPATIRKVMQGLTTEAPLRSSYPFSVNNSEYEVFNPVKLKAIISDIRISTEVLDGNLTPVQFNNLQARLDLVHPYLAHAPPEKQELILCITPHTSQTAQGRIIAEYIEGGIGHPGVVQLHPIILNSNLGAEYLNNFFVAVLFDEIQSHHLLGYNQEKGDIHTLGFLGTQPVILESVSGNIDALANMGIIPDPVWGQEISAARAKALLEPNYFIKEFNGKAQEQGLRFTFATLSIGCNDIKEDLPETAKRFVSYMGKFMADNDKCPCFAISILGLPAGFSIDIGLLQDFLGSMVKATDNLGIPIVGGHTVENSDVIYTIIFVEIITASKFTTVVREENVTFTQTGKRAFNEDKLITTHRAQGCAAKYPPDKLDEILKHAITRLPLDNFGNMHIKDDVILYHLDAQRSIAFTVDIIKPIVNSSTLFSRIAIVHAASDLYAKGIFPAGSIGVMFAPTYIKPASLSNIIQGGKEETSRLASAYLGTYSVANRDLFYGALMYGICERGAYISNSTIQDGDWLILSKPLGAGVIAGYMIMKGLELSLEEIKIYENMLSHLVEPNDKACYAVRTAGVHASTDVTGFSLIGHLNEMLESTGLAAELWLNNIPFLSGAEQFYSEAFSCSVNRNMHYFSDLVEVARAVDGYANAGKIALLYDAQTSGGILISASSEQVLKIMEILDDNNVKGAVVGRIIPRLEKPISIVEKPNCCVPNMPFHPEVEHSIPPVGKKSSSPITGHSNFLICYSLMEINKPINQGGVKCTIYRFLNSPALSLQMKGFLSMLNTLAGSLAITFLSSRVAGLREKAVPETGLSSARRSALLSEERPYAVFLKERSPLANDAISIIKNNSFCSSSPVEITAERIARIEKALSGEYRGKKFPSGETYFTHTKRVASKVMEFTSEEEVVYAAYLHKVSSEKEIKRILKGLGVDKSKAGRIIAYIKRLTGLINLPYGLNYKDQEAVNNRINLVIKLSESIEGLYLVLADKFISISTYTGKKDLLEEIACIYAPLAERLGLDELAGDFLDEVFRNYAGSIHNIIEKEIETVIGRSRTDANKYLNDLSEDIRNGLNEDGIRATVLSRVKKAFTAWLKINRGDEKYTSISDLTDILGITVIVESDVDVHGAVWYIGKILKGRFGININASNIDSKDIKLEGGYVIPGQKYHIDFEDGFGVKYEIQIYSQKTYREMRLGKMAHWSHKLQKIDALENQKFDVKPGVEAAENAAEIFSIISKYISEYKYINVIKLGSNIKAPITIKALRSPSESKIDSIASVLNVSDPHIRVCSLGEYFPDSQGDLSMVCRLKRGGDYLIKNGDLLIISDNDKKPVPQTIPLLHSNKIFNKISFGSSSPVSSDEIKEAIEKNDPDCILIGLNNLRKDDGHFDKEKVIQLMDVCSNAVERLCKTYTSQACWRVTKAIRQLSREDQKELLGFLKEHYTSEEYRDAPIPQLICSIFLLQSATDSEESKEAKVKFRFSFGEKIYKLMAKQLKWLEGRRVYLVAAEISYWGGGLGPVMVFLLKGITWILKYLRIKDASAESVELFYQLDNKGNPLDYTKEGLSETPRLIKEFTVLIGGTTRTVKAYQAADVDGGIRNLLQDVDGNGCGYQSASRMLYRYRENGLNEESASKYESIAFFDVAAAEFIRLQELDRRNELGSRWKPAIVHGNDGQCGYLTAIIKSRYEDDSVMNEILHYFTTHTYANRGVWWEVEEMKCYMTYLGIKPKYQAEAFRWEDGKMVGDETSLAIRLSQGANAVAADHRDDQCGIDEEWTHLVGIPNGADPMMLGKYFYESLMEIYDELEANEPKKCDIEPDFNRPTPELLWLAKARVIEKLNHAGIKTSTDRLIQLDPEKMTITNVGRAVPEKIARGPILIDKDGKTYMDPQGKEGLASDENIIAAVKAGRQVIIVGVEQGYELSNKIVADLRRLEQDIRNLKKESPSEYPGDFFFVNKVTAEEKKYIFAVSNWHVHWPYGPYGKTPTKKGTGANELTESPPIFAVAGAPRSEKGGVGATADQGAELGDNGRGNTLRFEYTEEGFRKAMVFLGEMWDADKNRYAQHCLNTPLLNEVMHYFTSSWAYLREFSKLIEANDKNMALDEKALVEIMAGLDGDDAAIKGVLETGRNGNGSFCFVDELTGQRHNSGNGLKNFVEKMNCTEREAGIGVFLHHYKGGHYYVYLHNLFDGLRSHECLIKWLEDLQQGPESLAKKDARLERFIERLKDLLDQKCRFQASSSPVSKESGALVKVESRSFILPSNENVFLVSSSPMDAWWQISDETYVVETMSIGALRRLENDPGIGKWTDIAPYFKSKLLSNGVRVAVMLPHYPILLESPYGSICQYAVNTDYNDWSEVPEVRGHKEEFGPLLTSPSREINHAELRYRESTILQKAFEIFQRECILNNTERAGQFKEFCKDHNNDWLDDFADFMVLHLIFSNRPWWEWEEGRVEQVRITPYYSELKNRYKYSQWIGYQQLAKAVRDVNAMGGHLLLDDAMFRAKDSVDVYRHHKEFFRDIYTRYPGIVNECSNERWMDLALWNWENLRKDGYKLKLDSIMHWLDFGFAGGRTDALHFSWNFGGGQLASGDEDGEDFAAALVKVYLERGKLPLAEAYEGKAGDAERLGFVVIDGNAKRLSTHDDHSRWYHRNAVDFMIGFNNLLQAQVSPRASKFIIYTMGDLWGDYELIKVVRITTSWGETIYATGFDRYDRSLKLKPEEIVLRESLWRYRIPLPNDPDYRQRSRYDLGPFIKFITQIYPRLQKEGKGIWEDEEAIACIMPTLYAAADSFVKSFDGIPQIWAASRDWFFEQWGRDTFISYTGCLLLQKWLHPEAKALLESFSRFERDGLIPNRIIDPVNPEYNTVDGSMWFVYVMTHRYLDYTGDTETIKQMLPVIRRVMLGYYNGTGYYDRNGQWQGIYADKEDGLIISPAQSTWMDAVPEQTAPVTPRNGKCVEIQGLWYANLRWLAKAMEEFGLHPENNEPDWKELAETVKNNFGDKFWNSNLKNPGEPDERENCLFDVIGPDETPYSAYHGAALRPNQLIALSVAPDLLPMEGQALVLDACNKDLSTPYGPRTLSPRDSSYHPHYDTYCQPRPDSADFSKHKDFAYHQGTSWPWLIGPEIDLLVRIKRWQNVAEAKIKEEVRFRTEKLLLRLFTHGSIDEVFNGGEPGSGASQYPGGTSSQAWSIAELLRILYEYKVCEEGISKETSSPVNAVYIQIIEITGSDIKPMVNYQAVSSPVNDIRLNTFVILLDWAKSRNKQEKERVWFGGDIVKDIKGKFGFSLSINSVRQRKKTVNAYLESIGEPVIRITNSGSKYEQFLSWVMNRSQEEKDKSWTIFELARATGVSVPSVYKYLSGILKKLFYADQPAIKRKLYNFSPEMITDIIYDWAINRTPEELSRLWLPGEIGRMTGLPEEVIVEYTGFAQSKLSQDGKEIITSASVINNGSDNRVVNVPAKRTNLLQLKEEMAVLGALGDDLVSISKSTGFSLRDTERYLTSALSRIALALKRPNGISLLEARILYNGQDNGDADKLRENSISLISSSPCVNKLDDREVSILVLFVLGKSNEDICKELNVGFGSLKRLLTSITVKLGVDKKRGQVAPLIIAAYKDSERYFESFPHYIHLSQVKEYVYKASKRGAEWLTEMELMTLGVIAEDILNGRPLKEAGKELGSKPVLRNRLYWVTKKLGTSRNYGKLLPVFMEVYKQEYELVNKQGGIISRDKLAEVVYILQRNESVAKQPAQEETGKVKESNPLLKTQIKLLETAIKAGLENKRISYKDIAACLGQSFITVRERVGEIRSILDIPKFLEPRYQTLVQCVVSAAEKGYIEYDAGEFKRFKFMFERKKLSLKLKQALLIQALVADRDMACRLLKIKEGADSIRRYNLFICGAMGIDKKGKNISEIIMFALKDGEISEKDIINTAMELEEGLRLCSIQYAIDKGYLPGVKYLFIQFKENIKSLSREELDLLSQVKSGSPDLRLEKSIFAKLNVEKALDLEEVRLLYGVFVNLYGQNDNSSSKEENGNGKKRMGRKPFERKWEAKYSDFRSLPDLKGINYVNYDNENGSGISSMYDGYRWPAREEEGVLGRECLNGNAAAREILAIIGMKIIIFR
ncbi:MAG: selenide, water dikinase SelD, partial [Candidatus Omnitrophica bacterium]|nr:selenide, water dikinase SelD [Candidatus Omnitrophota bacterium]